MRFILSSLVVLLAAALGAAESSTPIPLRDLPLLFVENSSNGWATAPREHTEKREPTILSSVVPGLSLSQGCSVCPRRASIPPTMILSHSHDSFHQLV